MSRFRLEESQMKDKGLRVDIRGDEEGHDEHFGPHFSSM